MESKSRKKNRITPRWLLRQLVLRVFPWVVLVWVVVAFVIANNSTVLKPLPVRADGTKELEQRLKAEEQPGHDIVRIQNLRAELISEYISKDQIVKAREQLITYKNWLDTNANLPLEARIKMHQKLANIYTSLGEFKAAVTENSLILQDLGSLEDRDSRILKARYYNNRGVANFFLSQSTEKDEERKKILADSMQDFRHSQSIIELNTSAESGGADSLANLNQIVRKNEQCLDVELMFAPMDLQP